MNLKTLPSNCYEYIRDRIAENRVVDADGTITEAAKDGTITIFHPEFDAGNKLERACEVFTEREQADILKKKGKHCGGSVLELHKLAWFIVEVAEPMRRMKATRLMLARRNRQEVANKVFDALEAVRSTHSLRSVLPQLEAAGQVLTERGFVKTGRGRPGITREHRIWLSDVLGVWVDAFGTHPATNDDSVFFDIVDILWKAELRGWEETVLEWNKEGSPIFNDCEIKSLIHVDWKKTLKLILQ